MLPAAFLESELTTEPVKNEKVEVARQLYASLESQVMLADRKVKAVFGLNTFLAAPISLQSQHSLNILFPMDLQQALLLEICC